MNMPLNAALAIYILYIVFVGKRYLHMLQLNSYMNNRFLKWYKLNFIKEISLLSLLPLISILLLYFDLDKFFFASWIFAYFILITRYSMAKTTEKKKFNFTGRVKRLYGAIAILLLIILIAANYVDLKMNAASTIIYFVLIFFIGEMKITYVLAANIVNYPIEKVVNKWFYNDAKKILNQNKNMVVVGITGSYGKTSTKFILNRLLTEKYNVLMTPESYNTLMGVIRTIREYLKPTHEIFIVEMGAKKSGDIKEICDLVKPKYGLLTSIGLQHLETFKNIENITRTKYELIDSLKADGVAFLNFENSIIRDKKVENLKYISFGIDNDLLHYWAENVTYDSKGLQFILCNYKKDRILLKTHLLGMHNVLNIVSACAVAMELGVAAEDIKLAVKQLPPVPHRLEFKNSKGSVSIIDDAYNSNPEGANEALNVLSKFSSKKRILITPGMVELGEREYECNRDFGIKAAETCDYIILVGIKRSKPILEGLNSVSYPKDKVVVTKNLKDALAIMKNIAVEGSVVLFENDLPDNYEE